MDLEINLKRVELSEKKINLPDSFVINKLGEGHGESTLYLGGKRDHTHVYNLFKKSITKKHKLLFSSKNILQIINFYEPFYINQHKFYLNNGELLGFKYDLKGLLKKEKIIQEKNNSIIDEEVEILEPDSQGRIYLRVDSSSILRRIFLPYSVYCVLFKYISPSQGELPFCKFYPILTSSKKNIRYKKKKMTIDIDYFTNYE
jgi:hypothetical protein